MAKEIAAQWKELPAKDRERMDTLAKTDMKRYREQVEKYEKDMVKKSREQRDEASVESRSSPEPPAPQETVPSPPTRVAKPAAVAEALPAPTSAASSSMMHPSMMGALELAMRNQEEMRLEQLLAAHQQELRERQLLEELQAMQLRDMQMRQLQQQMAVPNESYLVSQLRAQQARAGASGLGGGAGSPGLSGLLGHSGLGAGLGSPQALGLNQAALYQANLAAQLDQQAMLREYIQRYGA